jgi:hypothetical protein
MKYIELALVLVSVILGLSSVVSQPLLCLC